MAANVSLATNQRVAPEADPSRPPDYLIQFADSAVRIGPGSEVGVCFLLTPLDDSPALSGCVSRVAPVFRGGKAAAQSLLCAVAETTALTCQLVTQPTGDAVLALSPGFSVVGRLLLDRQPVAGATVRLVPIGLRVPRIVHLPIAMRPGQNPRFEIETHSNGAFALPELSPGRYALEMRLPSGRVIESPVFDVPIPTAAQVRAGRSARIIELGDFTAEVGFAMTIRVSDDRRTPVENADVTALQGNPMNENLVRAIGKSDPMGIARLSGLRAGEAVEVSCQKAGYQRVGRHVEPGVSDEVCELGRLAELTGRILDLDGGPIAQAWVRSSGEEPRGTRADAAGRFVLRGVASGAVRLEMGAQGYRREQRSIIAAPGAITDAGSILLQVGDVVEGRVEDGRDGEAIAGATVTEICPAECPSTLTEEDGAFSLAVGGRDVILRASAEGYAPVSRAVDPGPDASSPLVIALRPGGRIRVQVWNEEADTPCVSCLVFLEGHGGSLPRTDAEGRATSSPLSPGSYAVAVPSIRQMGGMIVNTPGRRIEGILVREGSTTEVTVGEPTREIDVVFDQPTATEWRVVAQDGTTSRVAFFGPEGSFRLRHRPGSPLRLRLSAGSSTVLVGEIDANEERTHLVVPLPKGAVVGKLEVRDGDSGEPRLQLFDLAGESVATTHTDASGSFEIPFLRDGLYRLRVGDLFLPINVVGGRRTDLGVIQGAPGDTVR